MAKNGLISLGWRYPDTLPVLEAPTRLSRS
uniref:Uncharacterized protein n=1 Tax=Physcomitrium patens TaxID=3218 RepID=A0A7I4FD65_PHYPA